MLFAVLGASQAFAQAPDIIKALYVLKLCITLYSSGSAMNILKVVMRVPQIRFSGGSKLDAVKGELLFENVKFNYPSRPDVAVLHDFSFKMEAGKKYALVGHSGSGTKIVIVIKIFQARVRFWVYWNASTNPRMVVKFIWMATILLIWILNGCINTSLALSRKSQPCSIAPFVTISFMVWAR